MRKSILPILFLTLFFFPRPLWAGEEFSLKAEVDKANITIGERVEYRVTVTHDPSLKILTKITPPPTHIFEIKEAHDFSERQGKLLVEGRLFVLTLYELGEYILDPVTVRYKDAKGAEKSVETNRLFLTVRSVDSSGKAKTDIRDVKGVLRLPRPWGWIGWVLLMIVLMSAGFLLWWQKRGKSQEEITPKEPPLSPEEEALLRFTRLFDSDLIQKGRVKEYFLEFSEILRHYLERRFEILAVESTTSEIVGDLTEKEVAHDLLVKIRQALEYADLAKFAKWRPDLSEITRINRLAKIIVEEARPKEVTPHAV